MQIGGKMENIFEAQLMLIEDEKIRQFTRDMLSQAPQAFFIREASSTNKYHPPSSRGYRGLVRHVQRCVYVAQQLLRNDIYAKLKPYNDVIISALLLHDTKKYGDNNSRWSLKNHADLAAYWVVDFPNDLIEKETQKMIAQLVLTHMGQWGKVVPSTALEKFVHLCDYIASLKELECEPDNLPLDEMKADALDMAQNPQAYQLSLDLQYDNEQVDQVPMDEQQKQRLVDSTDDEFLKEVLS
jgi:hypothetical protein